MIVAYTTQPATDTWFKLPDPPYNHPAVYTEADPFVIESAYDAYTLDPSKITDVTYSWDIPDFAGQYIQIKVSDPNDIDGVVYADSEEFEIRSWVGVTAPNTGNESWIVGDTETITWDFGGQAVSEVRIQYSIDAGVNWTPIDENEGSTADDGIVDNDGSFDWIIPDAIASTGTTVQVLLLIEDPNNPYIPISLRSIYTSVRCSFLSSLNFYSCMVLVLSWFGY